MPRDALATPTPPRIHPAIYAYAAARRAELIAALARLAGSRRSGVPYERQHRPIDIATVRAASAMAARVLP